jgi:hypothetical protein
MPFKLKYHAAPERSQPWLRSVLHTEQNTRSKQESVSMKQERLFSDGMRRNVRSKEVEIRSQSFLNIGIEHFLSISFLHKVILI